MEDSIGSGPLECTVGAFAYTWPDGNPRAITSSHCTVDTFDIDAQSTKMYQSANNSPNDVDSIGTEIWDPQHTCGTNPICRESDVAMFTALIDSVEFGRIARTETRGDEGDWHAETLEINHSNPRLRIVSRDMSPMDNDTIDKVGSASGWTSGWVSDTCVELKLPQPGPRYEVNCATKATYFAASGDSGGPVFVYLGGDSVQIVGFHFADSPTQGRSYFSSLDTLQGAFGQTLLFEGIPVEVEIPGPWDVPSGEPCTFYSNEWGGVPPYTYSWSGVLSGSSNNITGSITSSGYLSLTVTDAESDQASTSEWITVDEELEECEL